MMVVLAAIGSLILGAIGWLMIEFAGRPIRRFFDLRGEVIRRMALYADIRKLIIQSEGGEVDTPVVPEAIGARAREAEGVIRDLAAQMLSFADNEALATLIITHGLRYDARKAAVGLFALSYTMHTSGSLKKPPVEMVAEALHIDQGILF
jgi:hypothetical protein